ncbi:MAG: hypothetical protein WC806_04345 [Candidatus Gracilibacteria bacterium]|jgi:hypothetical protein
MLKKISKLFTIFFISNLLFANFAFAVSTSENFKVFGDTVNPIVNSLESETYKLDVSGLPAGGEQDSETYKANPSSLNNDPLIPDPEPAPTSTTAQSAAGGSTILSSKGKEKEIYILPTVTYLRIVNITQDQASLIFYTNTKTNAYIQYGEEESYNLQTGVDKSYDFDHFFTLGNLTPNTDYSFTIHGLDLDGNIFESNAYYFTTYPQITTIPNVSNFKTAIIKKLVELSWKNPQINIFKEVRIIKNQKTYPKTPEEGEVIFIGTIEQYLDENVEYDNSYYYTIYVYDSEGNSSSGAVASAYISKEKEEKEKEIEKLEETIIKTEKIKNEVYQEKINLLNELVETLSLKIKNLFTNLTELQKLKEVADEIESEKIILKIKEITEEIKQLEKKRANIESVEKKNIEKIFNDSITRSKDLIEQIKEIEELKEQMIKKEFEDKQEESKKIREDLFEILEKTQKKLDEIKKIKAEMQIEEEKIKEDEVLQKIIKETENEKKLRESLKNMIEKIIKKEQEINQIKKEIIEKKVFELLIQAHPPSLPQEVTPAKESGISKEDFIKLYSLVEQNISQNYKFLLDAAKDLSDESKNRLDRVKKGLIDQFGKVQEDIYQSLSEEEKTQVEKIIDKEMPEIFDKESVVEITPFGLDNVGEDVDWHIFADSNAVLAIPAKTFSKEVETITVTMKAEAYVLNFNSNTQNFEAIISSPKDKGKYQMIIQIIYKDHTYEELNKSVLVDPYGYVYELGFNIKNIKNFFIEKKRISSAKVIIFEKTRLGEWKMWPAHLYNQVNPQLTNNLGEFVFLVSKGDYYITVEADGYKTYKSKIMHVENEVLNINIGIEKPYVLVLKVIAFFAIILGILEIFIKKKKRGKLQK